MGSRDNHTEYTRELEQELAEAELERGQLKSAIASRDVIGQAKGIIMERDGCTEDQAFELLVKLSQSTNRKLRDIAQDVVDEVADSSEGCDDGSNSAT